MPAVVAVAVVEIRHLPLLVELAAVALAVMPLRPAQEQQELQTQVAAVVAQDMAGRLLLMAAQAAPVLLF